MSTNGPPFRQMILIDTPLAGAESIAQIRKMAKILRAAYARRQRSWESVSEAMRWMATNAPWNSFHPEIHRIIVVSIIRILHDVIVIGDILHRKHSSVKTLLILLILPQRPWWSRSQLAL